jgi:vacuolar-type H+-ATPase subunit I/STV1
MKKKDPKNGTNTENGLNESITSKDSSTQDGESGAEIARVDKNIESINRETTSRKPNSNVKIEDYDLIVNSLKDATTSFKDAILSISKKAQNIRDKAEETFTVGAKRDAKDIQALGSNVENIIKAFEDTMMEIKKRNYDDQKKLLKGYRKLLEEQINLINARIELVKRLKPR